jgi:ribonuclease HI
MPDDRHSVTIYTDGGCSPNPGPGGWGALLIAADGRIKELSGAELHTTNNRMELTAAIEALRALKRPCQVTLRTDSEYLRRGITEWLPAWIAHNWQRKGKKPVENEDLWRALHAATQRHDIRWEWVRGHAGDAYNERVHTLATRARERLLAASGRAAAMSADYEVTLRISLPKGSATGGWAARILPKEATSPELLTGRAAVDSSNQLWLTAARAVLQHLPAGVTVRLYAPDNYLIQGITRWVKGWQKNGWQTREGSSVRNRPAWEALLVEASRRMVQWSQEEGPPALAEGLAGLAAQAAREDS